MTTWHSMSEIPTYEGDDVIVTFYDEGLDPAWSTGICRYYAGESYKPDGMWSIRCWRTTMN